MPVRTQASADSRRAPALRAQQAEIQTVDEDLVASHRKESAGTGHAGVTVAPSGIRSGARDLRQRRRGFEDICSSAWAPRRGRKSNSSRLRLCAARCAYHPRASHTCVMVVRTSQLRSPAVTAQSFSTNGSSPTAASRRSSGFYFHNRPVLNPRSANLDHPAAQSPARALSSLPPAPLHRSRRLREPPVLRDRDPQRT